MFRVDTLSISNDRVIVIGVFQPTRSPGISPDQTPQQPMADSVCENPPVGAARNEYRQHCHSPALPLVSLYNWGVMKLRTTHRSKVGEEHA